MTHFKHPTFYVPCPLNHFLYIHLAIYVFPSLPRPTTSSLTPFANSLVTKPNLSSTKWYKWRPISYILWCLKRLENIKFLLLRHVWWTHRLHRYMHDLIEIEWMGLVCLCVCVPLDLKSSKVKRFHIQFFNVCFTMCNQKILAKWPLKYHIIEIAQFFFIFFYLFSICYIVVYWIKFSDAMQMIIIISFNITLKSKWETTKCGVRMI